MSKKQTKSTRAAFLFSVYISLQSMQDYNEKFSNPTVCMGRFFLWVEVDPRDQLQKLIYYKKNCMIWNNPDKIWKGIFNCLYFAVELEFVPRDQVSPLLVANCSLFLRINLVVSCNFLSIRIFWAVFICSFSILRWLLNLILTFGVWRIREA